MEEAKANAEEIAKLRKKVVAHEEECCVSWSCMHLKSKIGRKKKNVVERNMVKLLGFVVVVLWVFIYLLNIVIAMNVGGYRRNWVVAEFGYLLG